MNIKQGKNIKKYLIAYFIILFFVSLGINLSGRHTTNAWYADSSDLLQRYLLYDHYGIGVLSISEEVEFVFSEQDSLYERSSSESGADKFGQGLPVEEQKKEDAETEEDDQEEEELPEEIEEIETEDQIIDNEEFEENENENLSDSDTDHHNVSDDEPKEDN